MKRDPFAKPWTPGRIARTGALVASLLAVVGIVYAIAVTPASPRRYVQGIVVSASPMAAPRTSGGVREVASVRLANGKIVFTRVVPYGLSAPSFNNTLPEGPLHAGDAVTVMEQRNLFGNPGYEVVARR